MHRSPALCRFAALGSLLALLAATPSSAAGAKTATFRITWAGSGTMTRHYHRTVGGGNCSVEQTADDRSKFHWSVTWPKVVLHLNRKEDEISPEQSRNQRVRGTLGGKYTSTTKLVNGCDPQQPPENCGPKTVSFSSKHHPEDATLEISKSPSGKYQLFVDGQTGVGGGSECANDTAYGTKTGGYFWENFRADDPPTPLKPGALSAGGAIPGKLLRENGKVVEAFNSQVTLDPPGDGFDCSNPFAGDECTVNQSWTGHLTFLRTG